MQFEEIKKKVSSVAINPVLYKTSTWAMIGLFMALLLFVGQAACNSRPITAKGSSVLLSIVSHPLEASIQVLAHEEEPTEESTETTAENTEAQEITASSAPTVSGTTIAEIALSQVGYIPAVENETKYHQDLGIPMGTDWCGWFVQWVVIQAGRSDLIPDGPGWASSWTEEGVVHAYGDGYTPKAGDIVSFDRDGDGDIDHVGIVTGYADGVLYTVEGNTYVNGPYGVYARSYSEWTLVREI